MGIYIKGMEMPECCPCELVGVGYDTYCSFVYGIPSRIREYYECCENETRPDWCPIIEVPTPHGDLIDRDAIPWRNANHPTAGKWIDEAHIRIMPTIIEAEVKHE